MLSSCLVKLATSPFQSVDIPEWYSLPCNYCRQCAINACIHLHQWTTRLSLNQCCYAQLHKTRNVLGRSFPLSSIGRSSSHRVTLHINEHKYRSRSASRPWKTGQAVSADPASMLQILMFEVGGKSLVFGADQSS